MKLWLISQEKNAGYDTYDSAVVAAETIEDAKNTHPGTKDDFLYEVRDGLFWYRYKDFEWRRENDGAWVEPAFVTAKYLGETELPSGVVCASFNAG